MDFGTFYWADGCGENTLASWFTLCRCPAGEEEGMEG